MITLLDNAIPSFLTGNDPISGRFLSWFEAYHSTQFARFYRTEHNGGIAILDNQAVACLPPEDGEEASAFFNLQPEILTLYTNLSGVFDGKEKCFTAMKMSNVVEPTAPEETVRLQELYTFISQYFTDLPPFEAWYLDVSYRTRHGFCRHAVVTEDSSIVSSAMTVAEWGSGALLGGVATAPTHRRKGYAGRCVLALVSLLQKQGKTAWICPYNPPAQALYQSLGFEQNGVVTVVERM